MNNESRLIKKIHFISGNETVVNSHIPIDAVRRRKELLKREIQVRNNCKRLARMMCSLFFISEILLPLLYKIHIMRLYTL